MAPGARIIDCWTVHLNMMLGPSPQYLLANPTVALHFVYTGAGPAGLDIQRLHSQFQWTVSARLWRARLQPTTTCILIPVNFRNAHWTLLVVDTVKCKIEYWDSLYRGSKWPAEIPLCYLTSFVSVLLNEAPRQWLFKVKQVPQQTGTNCGVFVMEFMRAIVNGKRSKVSLCEEVKEDKMASCRVLIVHEIQQMQRNAPKK